MTIKVAIPPVLNSYQFSNLPELGTTQAGQTIQLGGFSGLAFEGTAVNGNLKFIANTDRGPNGEAAGSLRPFLLPDFAPELVRFELNPSSGQLLITERIQLKVSPSQLLTGLPNTSIASGTGNTPYNDEIPVDLFGNTLPLDPLGGDLEGLVVASDQTFWMVDEYRPAIYHFDSQGVLIDRFVPKGTAAATGQPEGTFGTEVLPEVLAQRRQNRGFEAVAYQDGKIYAFVQSPIRNPASLSNSTLNGLQNIRIVEFDPVTQKTRQFLYVMDNPPAPGEGNSRADKIGDAIAIGNGEFLVVERDDDAIDSDPLSQIEKKVYRFSLDDATDISNFSDPIDLGNGVVKTVDQMSATELAIASIQSINKVLHVDLATAGYNSVEKVEGLTVIDADTIALINDNDFQVANITIDNSTGTFIPDPNPEAIVLGLITTPSARLDNSIVGTNGKNSLYGTVADDFIYGLDGNDKLFGSEGENKLFGGAGNDTIYGGSRDDLIYGGSGKDTIYASEGNNTIYGGFGNDTIYSGSGNDWIDGGTGKDTIWLGGGQDIVVLAKGFGVDTINNFQDGQTKLGLAGGLTFAELKISQVTGATLIELVSSGEDLARLSWVQASNITESDFVIV
ncbi:MAG: esterase-like activity of phytase family protein [Coleofasciculus sp. S288]|nr:esterase-like activity of phytase family protein [Coleofasciculus sp. S288]